MPQCKAKFCTVRRGQGISTFPIPDPKKNRLLCEQWIIKLGIENLNIKTFTFSKKSIVCAEHFEEDCFVENMQAKLMGYKPKFRHLKLDAFPTIFKDSQQPKLRKTSEKRLQKKKQSEAVDEILNEKVEDMVVQSTEECPSSSGVSRKRKAVHERRPRKKVTKEKKEYVDVGIQVEPCVTDVNVSCNIQTETNSAHCSTCFAREHPQSAVNDHQYTNTSRLPYVAEQENVMKNNEKWENKEETEELKTPIKEYQNDPTYDPSDSSDTSPLSTPKTSRKQILPEDDYVNEKKFIVFSSCLNKLFGMLICNICNCSMDLDDTRNRNDGTCLTVALTCMQGHTRIWRSQPIIDHQPAGNILTSAAILLSGGTFDSFSSTLKLQFISRSTYHKIENDLVIPTVDKFWNQQKDIISRNMIERELVVSGDGRCDSPGFSAKYCTYTIMEATTSAILGFNVIQVTETDNSACKMELTGFKRTMQDLQTAGLTITTVATDRHVQIRKYIKDEHSQISHQFDVWHMAKSIRKKLLAASKKKGNEELIPWIKGISNHLWYCASKCNGDADILEEMWISIINHIQNIHQFDGKHFTQCGHNELSAEDQRKKKWITKGSKTMKALKEIILNKRFLKDIRQLNLFCHTGDLESYHSMMLKYVPKRLAFRYSQMIARTQLAALDHNFNLKRDQAIDADGNPQFGVIFPKATGRWSVRKLFVAKNYDFRTEMMTMTLNRKVLGETTKTPNQIKTLELPRNIAKVSAPSKSELVESHVSRFKLN